MKKIIKKVLAITVILTLIATLSIALVSCGNKNEQQINVVVPDGAPALAIANMLKNGFVYENYKVNFEIVAGAAEVSTKVSSKQADIAIMPTNIAAKLYSNNVDIKLVAANIFGVLYIVGTEQIESLDDLRGQEILVTGQGGTPDFVLKFLLGSAYDDVDIKYIAQGSDAIGALKAGTAKFALLGEPAASMAVAKAGATILFDLQELWQAKTAGDNGYPQAGTVATTNLIENHSGFLKAFLKEVKNNVNYIVETPVEEIKQALKDNNSAVEFSSTAIIERCNVRYVSGNDVKSSLINYYEIMMNYDDKFIGAQLPLESFYVTIAIY